MKFYYGLINNNIEITSNVYSKCLWNNLIIIPSNDNIRSLLFTDPHIGINKLLLIVNNNNELITIVDNTTNIYISLL